MVKQLAKSIREYKKESIATPILVAMEVVMECIIPFIISNLINDIKAGCGMDVLLRYGAQLVVMAGLSLTFGALAGRTCATASCGLARNLRKDMFYRIQTYSFENIDKFLTSSLVTRLTTDVTNVQTAYMMIIRTAIRAPLMLVFSFVMAFVMGGRMAWIFLVTLPLLSIGLALVISRTIPLFRKVFRKYDKLNESIQENIKAMRVVKSFVREDYEQRKFNAAAEDVCRDFTRAERILAFNGPMMQFCIYATMVFVLSFGSYTIITSRGLDLDVGQFSSLLTYNFMMLNSLMMLSMIFVMIVISMESCKRIVEVLTEESTLHDPANPVREVADGSIDFDNVSFKYNANAERMALSNIDLHIASGETIGIIGGTGSSKSSLIQLNQVSVVLQKNVLFSGTIKDNLRWGDKEATDEEMVRACQMACADEFISQFPDGYDTWIEQGGTNVSGGQKQRLCIARALLKKPKVLILDDSTSAVDTATDAKIRKAFAEKIPGTTKIIIAQRVSSVESADRILVLDNGAVNAFDTHENLLKSNPIYQEIYESQVKGGGDFDQPA